MRFLSSVRESPNKEMELPAGLALLERRARPIHLEVVSTFLVLLSAPASAKTPGRSSCLAAGCAMTQGKRASLLAGAAAILLLITAAFHLYRLRRREPDRSGRR